MTKIDWAVYVFVAKGLRKVGDLTLDAGECIEEHPVSFEEFIDIASGEHFAEPEIVPDVLRARLDPEKMTALKQLFGVDM